MRNALVLVLGTLGAIAIAGTVYFYFGTSAPAAGPEGGPAALAGAPAQSFTVKRLDGAPDALANYRGHVVFVNLWATWCAPCRSETPALEQLFERERSRGLIVIGIDQGESASAARAFAAEMKLRYPILVDEDQRYGRAYAAIGLPTSLVVDKTGHIVVGHDGELTLAQMQATVAPLLREQ